MKKFIFVFIFIFFLIASAKADNVGLDAITVDKSTVSVSSQEKIIPQDVPSLSLEESLDDSSSLNLQKRASFGLQQDISLRGSMFEDTGVYLNQVKINDPQTGHFNLEIPLTSADVESAGINKNSQQIAFNTLEPKARGSLLKAYYGRHDLMEGLFSTNFSFGDTKNRVSLEHKSSGGARPDTDCNINNISYDAVRQVADARQELLAGFSDKTFGADSFYSAIFNQEAEHTEQRFVSLNEDRKLDGFDIDNTVYYRQHNDKFFIDRYDEGLYYNYSITYLYGLNSKFSFGNAGLADVNLEEQKVCSIQLGGHERGHEGFDLGIKEQRYGNWFFSVKAGLDHWDQFNNLDNYQAGAGYFLNESLKLRAVYDRLWRPPSFTELYYSDPSNQGDEDLTPQRSDNYEAGFVFDLSKETNFNSSVFWRSQHDTIDWVKNNAPDIWQARNVGDLGARGADAGVNWRQDTGLFQSASLNYTYQDLNKPGSYNFSKYIFDYLRQKAVANLGLDIKSFKIFGAVDFSKPAKRGGYTTCDLKLEKSFNQVTFSLEGINVFNHKYQEIQGIDSDGRWIKAGAEYKF